MVMFMEHFDQPPSRIPRILIIRYLSVGGLDWWLVEAIHKEAKDFRIFLACAHLRFRAKPILCQEGLHWDNDVRKGVASLVPRTNEKGYRQTGYGGSCWLLVAPSHPVP